ncbi:hypothetical protein KZZ07_13185 [Mameliella sp. CS4]|uniref:hypothetical protein n=1 Tax=Mameliella sp. CS4 TaxID=2862329 RepID=UPI001C5E1646|nr:hypothetical protein [Mameliella sp. CS4]MBW4983495.1 hypothetical protein [Mameliella sp. CS4]
MAHAQRVALVSNFLDGKAQKAKVAATTDLAMVCRIGAGKLRHVAGILRQLSGKLRHVAGILRQLSGKLRHVAGVLRQLAGILRHSTM